MAWFRRKAKEVIPAYQVPGQNGFGFGPWHAVYDKRRMPDPGAASVAWLTELLPIEQRVGPAIENQAQRQSIRHPGEMMVALQGVGLTVLGAPGTPAGYFALQPLTNISSSPGNIPIIANAPFGSFNLPG
jgi:hypothetical protein